MGWILLLDPNYGVINTTLERLSFINESPFDIYSWWGIIWVHLMTSSIAFKVVMLAPAFRNINSALEESSRMAGVSPIGTFRKIVFPLAMPSIIVITMIALVISFQAFEIEQVLGSLRNIEVFSTKIFHLLRRTPCRLRSRNRPGSDSDIGTDPPGALPVLVRWQTPLHDRDRPVPGQPVPPRTLALDLLQPVRRLPRPLTHRPVELPRSPGYVHEALGLLQRPA